jgi:hypothetical protein
MSLRSSGSSASAAAPAVYNNDPAAILALKQIRMAAQGAQAPKQTTCFIDDFNNDDFNKLEA